MMAMFSNLSALELFIQERAVYVHEKANGAYRYEGKEARHYHACGVLSPRSYPSLLGG